MLRVETKRDGTEGARRNDRSVVFEGTAATTAEALADAVRRVYGEAAVTLPGVAEGLTAAGRIAGTLPAAGDADPVPSHPRGAWVHHRIAGRGSALSPDFAFELAAETPQQAADHVLVARLAAEMLGRPGVCSVPGGLAGTIGSVQPIADPPAAAGASAGPRDEPLAALREAFRCVAERTGRPVGPVTLRGRAGAGIVVVAEPGLAAARERFADRLASLDIECSVATLALLRPLDATAVAHVLEGCRLVVALVPPDDVDARVRMFALLGALGDGVRIELVEAAGEGPPEAGPGLLEALACTRERWEAARVPPASHSLPTFAAAPPGPWADPVLLGAAARAAAGDPRVSVVRGGRVAELVTVALERDGASGESGEVDALVVPAAEAPRIDPGVWGRLAPGARVVIAGVAGSLETVWETLPLRTRETLVARDARLAWFATDGETAGEVRAQPLIDGARLAAALADAGLPAVAAAILAAKTVSGSPADPAEGRGLRLEGDPAPIAPPHMAAWRRAIRVFHRDGEGAYSAADPWGAGALEPFGFAESFRAALEPGAGVIVAEPAGAPGGRSFAASFADAAAALEAEGSPLGLPGSLAAILGRLVERATEGRDGIAPLSAVLDEACTRLPARIDASAAGTAEAVREAARLREALGDGTAIALDGRAPARLCVLFERSVRREAAAKISAEMRDRAEALGERLRVDDSLAPEGRSPERLASSLGHGGARLDAAALAGSLPRTAGSKRLDPVRRARMERARATLALWGAAAVEPPKVVLVTPHGVAADLSGADEVLVHEEPLEAAIGLFDGIVSERLEALRALRAARLDLEGRFETERHGAALAALDARGLDDAETAWLPSIVVLETGARLRGRHLASLSRLIRSGRPVRVVAIETLDDLRGGRTFDGADAFDPGLGYVAVAHREAFVLQTSVVRPGHLAAGIGRLASFRGTALAIVTAPRPGAGRRERALLETAVVARETPCFVYDPSAGSNWAERFDLAGNPAPEASCVAVEAACEGPAGEGSAIVEAFTPAHAAAADPDRRAHFRVIPREAWDETQVPMAAWLDLPEEERRGRVPVLHAVGPTGIVIRVVTTWGMAHVCRDRLRAWRILGELAGYGNEHARRSAEAARGEAEREAAEAIRQIESEHAAALERTRVEAATETVDRLVAALLGNAALPAAPIRAEAQAAPAAPAPPAAVEAPAPEIAAAEEEAEEEPSAEPWLDSVLCTTCNECTNLNPRLFRYNANKQATIADPSAGTFEELVKAAEKCSPRCIHPGAPRADDPTVTPELLARAAKFR